MKPSAILLAAAVAAVAPLARATIFETNDQQRANLATVAKWTAAEAARAAGADSVKVERALRLDRAAGEVVGLAEFCDISSSATVEFPIVGETSDRDYEALFRTFARPGAIARAIEALGVPRGRNVDTAALALRRARRDRRRPLRRDQRRLQADPVVHRRHADARPPRLRQLRLLRVAR